jgi:hypothetical protein
MLQALQFDSAADGWTVSNVTWNHEWVSMTMTLLAFAFEYDSVMRMIFKKNTTF